MKERRKYPRFEVRLKAKYKVLSKDPYVVVDAKNISAEGMCFESESFLKPGTRVDIEIDLGDGSSPVKFTGEVRWSKETKDRSSGDKKYLNGIRLTNLPESDEWRFLRYYCERIVEKLSFYLDKYEEAS